MSRTNTALAPIFTEFTSSSTRRTTKGGNNLLPLLPGQYYGFSQRPSLFWSGERRLMLAVLQDAVAGWFRYRNGRSARERRLFQEVENWFAASDQAWLFSFERICHCLDLNPGYLRRKLREWQTHAHHLLMAPRARPVLPTKLLQTPTRRRKPRGAQPGAPFEDAALQDDAA